MTNTTTAITNAAMMNALINFANENNDLFAAYCETAHVDLEAVTLKAARHYETLTKKRTRTTTKSEAAINNERMAYELAESLTPDQIITLNDIQIKFGLQHPQKASAVIKVARDLGLIENAPKAKKSAPACYRLAQA